MTISSRPEIYQWWTNIGGTYSDIDQSKALPAGRTRQYTRAPDGPTGEEVITEVDVAGGICATLCLKFVQCRLTGCASLDELRTSLIGNIDVAMRQQALYQTYRTAADGVRRRLKAADEAGDRVGVRNGGYGCKRAVSSRSDLCDKVFAGRQIYVYSFGNQRVGHAVVFDSSEDLYFFDPNFGIFRMDWARLNRGSFKAWFKALWDYRFIDGNHSYKSLFPKGRRELVEFGPAQVRFQLGALFVPERPLSGVTGW